MCLLAIFNSVKWSGIGTLVAYIYVDVASINEALFSNAVVVNGRVSARFATFGMSVVVFMFCGFAASLTVPCLETRGLSVLQSLQRISDKWN